METDQKAELGETKEESLARHDQHFLHLLGQATAAFQANPEQTEYKEPSPYYLKQGKRDLRFSIGFRDELNDEKSYIQIGVGQVTTTGLFLTGCSVIQFFAFYPCGCVPSAMPSNDSRIGNGGLIRTRASPVRP